MVDTIMDITPRPLSSAERLDWLRLIRCENVGPVTFARLIDRFGTAANALEALPDLARNGGRSKPIKICSRAAAEREALAAQAIGARLLCAAEPDYPALLRAIDDAPPCLYVLGDSALLQRPCVGLVGTRNASAGAKQFTRKLAMDLGAQGIMVASGLARGIDTAAHEGSLNGGTIAAMAGGVDVVYPPENARLHAAIAAQGVVLSEHPPGLEPQARHFPRRNRLISGLSRAVVVVEASLRSGSLITARLAAEQGRDVFAVPGSPLDGRSEGPNQLLRDGAILCRGIHDVLEQLSGPLFTPLGEPSRQDFNGPVSTTPSAAALAEGREKVLSHLSVAPVMVDEIIRQCQLSASIVSFVLLELDLAGRLERFPGNRVSLLPDA